MLQLGSDALREALRDLRSVVIFSDSIRRHFSDDPDLSPSAESLGATIYIGARASLPPSITHLVYTHCASVTRLYAIYESYVFELLESWLAEICHLADSWGDLPPELCKHYRSGVGILLQKFGGPRTAHLTEISIVQALHNGLSGGRPQALLAEAFFLDLPNLREPDLNALFAKVGMERLTTWLTHFPALETYCEQNGCSVESRLKSLVDYRNEAAHTAIDISEVLGLSEFLSYVEFIELVCLACSEFVRRNLLAKARSKGNADEIGSVTEFFAGPGASIATMHAAELRCGATITIQTGTQCFLATVQSMQVDGVDVDQVVAAEGQELGIRFSPPARRGATLHVAKAFVRAPVEISPESATADVQAALVPDQTRLAPPPDTETQ